MVVKPFPRISTLADSAGAIAGATGVDGITLARMLAGVTTFGVAALAVAIWQLERKDF